MGVQFAIFLFGALMWEKACPTVIPMIWLDLTDSCRSEALFEWLIYEEDNGLSNCTIQYDYTENFTDSARTVQTLAFMKNSGTFVIKDLVLDLAYYVQIVCLTASSDSIQFSIQDKDCDSIDIQSTTSETSVVEFKEHTSILGTRDSVLGIVFALFGLLIIVVTTFYIVRKIRRRQRLERIRRYLGSSLIDPFENMQDRTQENGSERLIESTDS